jgi:hypothetical protein
MWGVADVCLEMMDVVYALRVCPVGNPCGWPNCVPPQRRACVYDTVFFSRNVCRINVLLSPCLCTANSGLRIHDNEGRHYNGYKGAPRRCRN